MKLLVVSSHPLVGQSVVAMLGDLGGEQPIETQICAPGIVVQTVQEWLPDLIVVEAVTDFASRIATIRAIREVLLQIFIIVVGGDDDDAAVYEAISAGADGYLPRDASLEALIFTVNRVARGELGLSPEAALRVLRQLRLNLGRQRPRCLPTPHDPLTQREVEILELVRAGLRSRDIAKRLSIAEGTVYKHIHHVLEKLHVHSRHQAALVTEQDSNAIDNA